MVFENSDEEIEKNEQESRIRTKKKLEMCVFDTFSFLLKVFVTFNKTGEFVFPKFQDYHFR